MSVSRTGNREIDTPRTILDDELPPSIRTAGVLPPPSGLCPDQFSVILKMCSLPKMMIFTGVPVTSEGPTQIVGGSAPGGPFKIDTSKQTVISSLASSDHEVGSNLAIRLPF